MSLMQQAAEDGMARSGEEISVDDRVIYSIGSRNAVQSTARLPTDCILPSVGGGGIQATDDSEIVRATREVRRAKSGSKSNMRITILGTHFDPPSSMRVASRACSTMYLVSG